MKMKHILENWNKFLLKENSFYKNGVEIIKATTQELDQRIIRNFKRLETFIQNERIKKNNPNLKVEIVFNELIKNTQNICFIAFKSNIKEISGRIEFAQLNKKSDDGFGEGSYKILKTFDVRPAELGIGTLLYELVLEQLGTKELFLVCDRTSVTEEAQNVWNIYNQRSDITKKQLDISYDNIERFEFKDNSGNTQKLKQITPNYEDDDIEQYMAISDKGINWKDSAFSKAYTKENTSLTNLIINSNFINFSFQTLNNRDLYFNNLESINNYDINKSSFRRNDQDDEDNYF